MASSLDKQRAKTLLDRAGESKIVVLGDVMLDEFLWGEVSRISPEAPVPVVNVTGVGESARAGGAELCNRRRRQRLCRRKDSDVSA